MAVTVTEMLDDLRAEQDDLDAIVAPLTDADWRTPTPSPGWTITDQIGHLTYFDGAAVLAITDPEAFAAEVATLATMWQDDEAGVDEHTLSDYRTMTPRTLLDAWRDGRRLLAEAAGGLDPKTRIPWYGPPMGTLSFLTARLMETWAHGQDVADAVGVVRSPTDRLRHIARLGFITRAWSYLNRGLQPPDGEVRLELSGPSDTWRFGPLDAPDHVTGPAVDFCLVTTQRRHLDDTDLVASPLAREWLLIAQAFAGPPTSGPPAR